MQRHRRNGQRQPQRRVERTHHKPRIFEEPEQPQIDGYRGDQRRAPQPGPFIPLFQQQAMRPVRQRGKQHQHHVYRLTPGIEHQRNGEQHRVARLPRRDEVGDQRQRQKQRKKAQAGKYHARLPLSKQRNSKKGGEIAPASSANRVVYSAASRLLNSSTAAWGALQTTIITYLPLETT